MFRLGVVLDPPSSLLRDEDNRLAAKHPMVVQRMAPGTVLPLRAVAARMEWHRGHPASKTFSLLLQQ